MAKWVNQLKLAWLKGMEVLGTSASNLASNAKHKVAEINLETRRREILTEFSIKAFDLWQKGETLPEPLSAMLQELSEVDERLSVLKAQKYAPVEGSGIRGKEAEKEIQEEGAAEAVSAEASLEEAAERAPEGMAEAAAQTPDEEIQPEEHHFSEETLSGEETWNVSPEAETEE